MKKERLGKIHILDDNGHVLCSLRNRIGKCIVTSESVRQLSSMHKSNWCKRCLIKFIKNEERSFKNDQR